MLLCMYFRGKFAKTGFLNIGEILKVARDKRPYREIAKIYDELVGKAAFECWLENFLQVVERYGIGFRICADVACGTGLAAQYLSRVCERVYAVDLSHWMLEVARGRQYSSEVIFLEQPFTGLLLPEKVDLVTCNFDSLNYLLEEKELAETVRRFSRALEHGGYAIFDINTTRELAEGWGDDVLFHRLSNAFSVWETSWDAEARINTVRMTNFIRVDDDSYGMSEEVHRERAYDLELILGYLRKAGFSKTEAFDAKDLGGVDEDTRRVQFVARK
jgi:ubiquinone/menaquinone biosynthesis C-methylase UbiE